MSQKPTLSGKIHTFYFCIQHKQNSGWNFFSQEATTPEYYFTFVFYPIEYIKFTGKEPQTYSKPIRLQIIDPITAKVSPVTQIKRNDFINIYITSNYNEKNSFLDFEVKPWDNKNNDITFN